MLIQNFAILLEKLVVWLCIIYKPGLKLRNLAGLVENQPGASALTKHCRWSCLGRFDVVHVPLAEFGALPPSKLFAAANY